MTNDLHVEPADGQRGALALWLLERNPRTLTTSTGFRVPLELYPDVPAELLADAYVDGYRVGTEQPSEQAPDLGNSEAESTELGTEQGDRATESTERAAESTEQVPRRTRRGTKGAGA